MVTQTVTSVEPVRALMFALERLLCSDKNGNVGATEFGSIQGVSHCLLSGHVAGDDGNRENANVWRSKRHDESNGIVRCSVGVDEERGFHAA